MSINPGQLISEEPSRPPASTFFCIVSFNQMEAYFKTKELCEKSFSTVYLESNPMPRYTPDLTEKSINLLGEGTKILAFHRRIHRDELPELKKKCILIRDKVGKKDSSLRLIPGYLSPHNVILSSVYDDFHRIYLFRGIYAEVIYKYERLHLQYIDTAPEFFSMSEVIFFFNALRDYHIQTDIKF